MRFVFNYFLNERIDQYRESKKSDSYHKQASTLTLLKNTICLEDLDVKGMAANRRLAKHIGDAGWGIFIRLVEYKAEWNNRQVVKINRFYPSSKTCSECGYIYHDLTLSERTWTCGGGHILDRDINASKNILAEGLRIIGAELSDYTDGGSDQTSEKKHKPVKSEAH